MYRTTREELTDGQEFGNLHKGAHGKLLVGVLQLPDDGFVFHEGRFHHRALVAQLLRLGRRVRHVEGDHADLRPLEVRLRLVFGPGERDVRSVDHGCGHEDGDVRRAVLVRGGDDAFGLVRHDGVLQLRFGEGGVLVRGQACGGYRVDPLVHFACARTRLLLRRFGGGALPPPRKNRKKPLHNGFPIFPKQENMPSM